MRSAWEDAKWEEELREERQRKKLLEEDAANFEYSVGGEPPNYNPDRKPGPRRFTIWKKLLGIIDDVVSGTIPLETWIRIHNIHIWNVNSASAMAYSYAKEQGHRCQVSVECHRPRRMRAIFWFRIVPKDKDNIAM
jgi:hypothetical protein